MIRTENLSCILPVCIKDGLSTLILIHKYYSRYEYSSLLSVRVPVALVLPHVAFLFKMYLDVRILFYLQYRAVLLYFYEYCSSYTAVALQRYIYDTGTILSRRRRL